VDGVLVTAFFSTGAPKRKKEKRKRSDFREFQSSEVREK
jgi:hypothetical protein